MTAPAPARLTSRAERTRATILETAEALFAERGFEATRLEDVAERVGIRRASIVYYFRDKRELYEAVLQDVFEELLAALPDLELASDTPLSLRPSNFIVGLQSMPVAFKKGSGLEL